LYDVQGLSGDYNLFLPRQEEETAPLQHKVTVRYSLVEEKHLSRTVFEGYLVRLSPKRGQIFTEDVAPLMSNIRIRLCANDGEALLENLYGKVLMHLAGGDKGFLVHFTSPLP
jgi:adenylate cyclase